ncbi:MAG: hypothetical protein JWO07_843 [Candidatus Saccharibacteria bacterium]|nr:hypothetical protein [Candidatus Saccharibacteria bacterium]
MPSGQSLVAYLADEMIVTQYFLYFTIFVCLSFRVCLCHGNYNAHTSEKKHQTTDYPDGLARSRYYPIDCTLCNI